jgi:predicted nucleic acid-binding protein
MISFDTNILVYATTSISDVRVMGARDLVARAMRTASCVRLLQALAEFSSVAIRKARILVKDI